MRSESLCDESVLITVPNSMRSQEKKHPDPDKGKEIMESKTDRIAELPDKILSSIVSFFTVRDAANASVLSTRWGNLCASKPILDFDVNSMFRGHDEFNGKHEAGVCRQYKDIFVRGVNQFLKYYKGSRLVYFRLSFCLEKDSTYDIDQWVSFALSMGVKDIYLNLSCHTCHKWHKTCHEQLYTLRSELFSQANMPTVQKLGLRSCILGPGVINQFGTLKSLSMSTVILSAHDAETITSCCLNLKSLILESCTLIPILCIPASLHLLEFLAITDCCGVEEIKLCATSLTRFDYDDNSLQISSSGAPNLKQVFFRALDAKGVQYLFSQLAKDLPLVETLSVYSRANWVQCLPEQITTFSKVKQLELFSPINIKFDIFKIIDVLEACPLLEKFHLVMVSLFCVKTRDYSCPLENVHKYLKEVRIGGFECCASFIEFVTCILEYGVALERMVIDPKRKYYHGVDRWLSCRSRKSWNERERQMICSLLQNHPKSALIIIK